MIVWRVLGQALPDFAAGASAFLGAGRGLGPEPGDWRHGPAGIFRRFRGARARKGASSGLEVDNFAHGIHPLRFAHSPKAAQQVRRQIGQCAGKAQNGAGESGAALVNDMTQDPFLLRQDDAGVVTLVLNRPESRNGLSLGMLGALRDALAAIEAESSARVVILAGAGPAFCAGHDLKEMRARDYDPAYVKDLFALCAEVMQAIVALPKPVIARVHGVATAAGAQLVASADLALADEDARFATPGVQIGLFCSTPMVALSRNIARKHAMQMLLTGDLIDAETALRFGLVNDIVPAAELEARTFALARKIASKSPLTLAVGKKAFYRQAELPLAEAYAFASDVMAENLKARDAREGIGAFLDKRPPCWTGE